MTKRMGCSLARFLTLILIGMLAIIQSGCGSAQSDDDNASIDNEKVSISSVAGKSNVVIFTPSDGISITAHTPLNKWAKFTPLITKALTDKGFPSKSIRVKTDASLDKQREDIENYVTDQLLTASTETKKHTVLIVAPVTPEHSGNEQYGDYVSSPSDLANSSSEKKTADDSTTDAQNDDERKEEKSKAAADAKAMVKALKKAQQAGAHTGLLANSLDDFTPDFFVSMSTAEQIGTLQAHQLVSKLALEKVTADHPKSIEILIPFSEDGTGSDSSRIFASEAFKGIWDTLGPYFKDGRAVSASNTLGKQSSEKDWKKVSFNASKTSDVREAINTRLTGGSKDAQPHHVDGIIAMNDFVSSGVVEELTSLKYSGSAADVNPEIDVSGIVSSLTSKRNLNRQAVPKPKDSKQNSNDADDVPKVNDSNNMSWPIVTGYGSYLDMIPYVVNGKQWMTGMENIQKLSTDIADAAGTLVAEKPLTDCPSISSMPINGTTTNVIHEEAMAISAGNLKKTLIEPGYISLADAEL
ncbi:hypothetical protein FHX77_000157 [Bifidobacterium commune]|uniref:Substrate-binding protein domain-containing protein n=1 Tax=Bifidobacterium commune TaxID=1505727 RepID=A0A1C4H1H0_9BIFI|nr:hypothetical protein [Bifidobacterium commune]MBB2954777.1 hypothetical protein [Bifidobacterium commune]SCC78759.1 hypothetical protein GA0061077_0410 [Bifidobacterium commune]